MLSRSRIVILLVVTTAIGVNTSSVSEGGYYAGGVHHWTEGREMGWPCRFVGCQIEYWANYGDPMFSQATTYDWRIHPPQDVSWNGWDGLRMRALLMTLAWWTAAGWLIWSIVGNDKWQFGLKQLLLLPVIVGSAFLLSSLSY